MSTYITSHLYGTLSRRADDDHYHSKDTERDTSMDCADELDIAAGLSPEVQRAQSLAERLFSLEEPWRSRFLELIAAHAEAPSAADLCQEEVAEWLCNQRLYQQVRLMLRAWTHSH
jgi:hypothetical protein